VAGTDVAAAINSAPTTIVEYGVDPRGAGLFAALTGAAAATLAGAQRVIDPQRRFTGQAASPQNFRSSALGVASPLVRNVSTLGDERSTSPIDDVTLRLFADRLRRGNR